MHIYGCSGSKGSTSFFTRIMLRSGLCVNDLAISEDLVPSVVKVPELSPQLRRTILSSNNFTVYGEYVKVVAY